MTPEHDRVADHLRVLSVFYYISAGLSLFGGCVGLIYVVFGVVLIGVGASDPEAQGAGLAGGVVVVVGLAVVLFVVGTAYASFLTARSLVARKRYMLCMIVAGVHCMNIPLGMVLGIFTFIILLKPEAKQLFGLEPMPSANPGYPIGDGQYVMDAPPTRPQ